MTDIFRASLQAHVLAVSQIKIRPFTSTACPINCSPNIPRHTDSVNDAVVELITDKQKLHNATSYVHCTAYIIYGPLIVHTHTNIKINPITDLDRP